MNEIRDRIKSYFSDIIFSPSGLSKRIKNAPREYIEYCKNVLKEEPEWLKISYIVIGICKDIELGFCKTCGKKLTYLQLRKDGYCSRRCVVTNKDIRKDIAKKQLKTNLEKYGCSNPMQSKIIQEKVKQTCIKKYGTNSFLASTIAREKIKDTNIKKYGNENVFGAKEIQDKIKETNKEKYGNEIYINTKDFKEKQEKTYLEKYNYTHPELKFKVDEILTWKNHIIPLFDLKDYKGTKEIYKWKCVKCGHEFYSNIRRNYENKDFKFIPRCAKCYPYIRIGFSKQEKELFDFCCQYYNIISNNKTIIHPYELDIVIPNIKLAIEFNGIFWHNINCKVKNYHLNKLNACEAIGYHLIQIWEDDWNNDKENIKSRLVKIFNNEEEQFSDKILKLDRDWYQNKEIFGYKLIKVEEPEIILRENCSCENSGYLIYEKYIDKK